MSRWRARARLSVVAGVAVLVAGCAVPNATIATVAQNWRSPSAHPGESRR